MPRLRDVKDQEVPTEFLEMVRHPESGRCLLCGYGPLTGKSCLGLCPSGDCICCASGLSETQLDNLTAELLEED